MIVRNEPTPRTATRRPRRLIGISLLPASATLGNLLCGFLAVYACLLSVRAEYSLHSYNVQPRVLISSLEHVFPTHIATGAYLLILAMFFDALDGRLARITRRTSEFGAQLDSLSDVVSFGLAPAILMVTLLMRPAADSPMQEPDVSAVQRRIGMIAAAVYVSCAAIRLARFNVENVKSESGLKAFSGLPSPGAAAAVVAMIVLHEQLHEHWRHTANAAGGFDWPAAWRWVLAAVAIVVGLLMVSRYDYIHVFNRYLRGKHPPTRLVWVILFVCLAWFSFELLFVVIALLYALSGPVGTWVGRLRPPGASSDAALDSGSPPP